MIFILLFLSLFNINEKAIEKKASLYNSLYNAENFVAEKQEINSLNIDKNKLEAEVILVKEFNGKILLSKNAFLEKPVASLTKLMSSYLSYLIFAQNQIFVFDKESIDQEGEVGNFYIGEKIKKDEALKASLVASSNDSIFLLAKNYGLENFIKLMNEKAKEIGMTKTYFFDPTGLSSKNVSTAYDLYLLSKKIYSETPEIFQFSTLEKVDLNGKILWTTNILLPKYKNFIVGAKTGFTPDAGGCLLLILKFKNSPFLSVIILNSKDRFSDAEKIIQALKNYYGD